jgi:hypothetical protein
MEEKKLEKNFYKELLISSINASLGTSVKVNKSDRQAEVERLKNEWNKAQNQGKLGVKQTANPLSPKASSSSSLAASSRFSVPSSFSSKSLPQTFSSLPVTPQSSSKLLSSLIPSSSISPFASAHTSYSSLPSAVLSFSNWSSKGPIYAVKDVDKTALPLIPSFPLRVRFVFTRNQLVEAYTGVQVFFLLFVFYLG